MSETEYVLSEDDNVESVAQELLSKAEEPGHVMWSPRPNVPHGGVYVLTGSVAEEVIAARQAVRDAQAQQIQQGLDFADQRDSHDAVRAGLVTPEEAGFPAAIGVDPGAPGTEGGDPADDRTDAEKAEDAADDATVDDPSTPENEQQAAQERKAARLAARRSRTNKDAEASSDTEGK